jgi:hypothetical protein
MGGFAIRYLLSPTCSQALGGLQSQEMMWQLLTGAISVLKLNNWEMVASGPLTTFNNKPARLLYKWCNPALFPPLLYYETVWSFDVYLKGQYLKKTESEWLTQFVICLERIASIFGIPLHAIHIFHLTLTPVIAFFQGFQLFYNVSHFETTMDSAYGGRDEIGFEAVRLLYWYSTTCHELAHAF